MKKPEITQGEWQFIISEDSHQVRLMSTSGDQVMDFVRYGFQRAQPRFYTNGLMAKAEDLSMIVEGREHHKSWHKRIEHPVAQLIESVPEMLDALIGAYNLSGLWEPDMDTVPPEHEGEAEALLRMKRKIEQALKKAGCKE